MARDRTSFGGESLYDPAGADGAVATPRAIGRVVIEAAAKRDGTALVDLRQEGSAKAFFPQSAAPALDAVVLNTAGGVTGGDVFHYDAEVGPGAWLRIATQAAERAYRASPGLLGRIETRLRLGDRARLHWLPQETILFDGAALSRRLTVDLADRAEFLAVEPLVFGRAAMGETLKNIFFTDHWRVRRGGELIFADAIRMTGDAARLLSRPATGAGAGAIASVLYVGDDAAAKALVLRDLSPVNAGASVIRPGVLAARILAVDALALRRVLTPALEALGGGPLPKVWTI